MQFIAEGPEQVVKSSIADKMKSVVRGVGYMLKSGFPIQKKQPDILVTIPKEMLIVPLGDFNNRSSFLIGVIQFIGALPLLREVIVKSDTESPIHHELKSIYSGKVSKRVVAKFAD